MHEPRFTLEHFQLSGSGSGRASAVSHAYVIIPPVRLQAELDVTGTLHLSPGNTLFDDDLQLAIAMAMRDLTLEKLTERFASQTHRDRERNVERQQYNSRA